MNQLNRVEARIAQVAAVPAKVKTLWDARIKAMGAKIISSSVEGDSAVYVVKSPWTPLSKGTEHGIIGYVVVSGGPKPNQLTITVDLSDLDD
jgi:hypothetical protein